MIPLEFLLKWNCWNSAKIMFKCDGKCLNYCGKVVWELSTVCMSVKHLLKLWSWVFFSFVILWKCTRVLLHLRVDFLPIFSLTVRMHGWAVMYFLHSAVKNLTSPSSGPRIWWIFTFCELYLDYIPCYVNFFPLSVTLFYFCPQTSVELLQQKLFYFGVMRVIM